MIVWPFEATSMVRVVEFSILGVTIASGKNHGGGIQYIGTLVKLRWPSDRAALWLYKAVFTFI